MSNLLITGLSKSGTTLLMSLLDGHKGIFMYPEEPFLRDVFRKRYKNVKEMLKDFEKCNPVLRDKKIRYDNIKFSVDEYISLCNSSWQAGYTVGLHQLLSDATAYACRIVKEDAYGDFDFEHDYPKYLAFKDTNFFSLDKFFSLNYHNKAIVIQRDLRANYASAMRSNDKKRDIRNLLNYISFWYWADMYYGKAQEEFGEDRILIIKYEDLIMLVEEVLGGILDFLDIDMWENILLKPTCLGKEVKVNTATADKKEIYKDSIYRWSKDLSVKEKIILGFFNSNPRLMEILAIGRTAIKAARNSKR